MIEWPTYSWPIPKQVFGPPSFSDFNPNQVVKFSLVCKYVQELSSMQNVIFAVSYILCSIKAVKPWVKNFTRGGFKQNCSREAWKPQVDKLNWFLCMLKILNFLTTRLQSLAEA